MDSGLTKMEVMKQITCESEANACSRSLRVRIQIKKGDIMRNVKMRFRLEIKVVITCIERK